MGSIVSVNISDKKGIRKIPVEEIVLKTDYGIEGDAHASSEWHRQVSLLAYESIQKMQDFGLNVSPGDFAENLTTVGIELYSLPVGTGVSVGGEVVLEISQIGKECHTGCAIYRQVGKCIMPEEGVFARVIRGGLVKAEDTIKVKGEERQDGGEGDCALHQTESYLTQFFARRLYHYCQPQ